MENTLSEALNKADEKLPTMEQLQLINEKKASMILTEIQNGLVSKVKQEQINIININIININKLEETKELYNSKYQEYFKKEAEKRSIF